MDAKIKLAEKLAMQTQASHWEARWSALFIKLMLAWLFFVASFFVLVPHELSAGAWVTMLAAGTGCCVALAYLLAQRVDKRE